MGKDVTAEVTKSAGTDTPQPVESAPKRTRKPVEPDQRTLIVRGIRRSHWALMLAALDGSADAIARLFGNVSPAEPVAPILADEDRTDNAAVLAHVDALNAYANAVREFPAMLDAYNVANTERSHIRNGINAALLDIPLRKRNGTDDESDTEESTEEASESAS